MGLIYDFLFYFQLLEDKYYNGTFIGNTLKLEIILIEKILILY